MSALSFPRLPSLSRGRPSLAIAGAVGGVAFGLICGRLASSHYGKAALVAGVGLPLIVVAFTLVMRHPSWGVTAIAASLLAIPSYAAPVVFHITLHPALVLCAVLAAAVALGSVAGLGARLSIVDRAVIVLVLAVLLAVLAGPRSWQDALTLLWAWLPPYLAGRAVGTWTPLNRRFGQTVVFGGVLLAPLAFAEAVGAGNPFFGIQAGSGDGAIWAHSHARLGEAFRVQTSFGHPIAYAMFVAVAIVFALVLVGASRSRRERLLYSGAALVLLACEGLALSRAGWVVLGVSAVVLAAGRRQNMASQIARRAVVVGVAGLLLLSAVAPKLATVPLSLAGLQADSSGQALNQSTAYRTGLYGTAVSSGVASWFGNKTSKLTNTVETANASIDSEYLFLLDTWGVLVTGALLLVVACVAAHALRKGENEWSAAFAATAVGSAVALASVALITQQQWLVWLLLGAAAATPTPAPFGRGRLSDAVTALRPRGEPEPLQPRTNLEVLGATLKRRWWILPLCAVLAAAATYAIPRLRGRHYTASASLLVQAPHFDRLLFGQSFFTLPRGPRAAATNRALITLPVVAQRVAASLPGISSTRVAHEVRVAEVGPSDVFTFTVTDQNPRAAQAIANAYAREYVQFRDERNKITVASALVKRQLTGLSPAQRRGPIAQSLRKRASELAIIASLQTGDAQLVQPAALPASPQLPRTKNAAYGGLLGALIGLLIVLRLALVSPRLRDTAAVEDAHGVPILGALPKTHGFSLSAPTTEVPREAAEAMALLRARLRYFNLDPGISSLLVTSAGPGEGKTTVAFRLAVAEAMAGNTSVLLVEADLRRPTLARGLGIPSAPGLSELLAGDAAVDEVIGELSVPSHAAGEANARTISVITAGAPPSNPAELVESEAMRRLLDELSLRFDLVIIDTPPLAIIADAMPLVRLVSGVLLVSRIGRTTREGALRLRTQLDRLDAPTLGVVVNGTPDRRLRRRPGTRGGQRS